MHHYQQIITLLFIENEHGTPHFTLTSRAISPFITTRARRNSQGPHHE
jgi:hypothetical protein